MTDDPKPNEPTGDEGKAFTQEDVDAAVEKIAAKIRAEERRKVSEKFADYDDLKAKAGQARTAEERITALENEIGAAQLAAKRAQIVNEFGLTEKQAAALQYAPSEEAAREIAEGLAAESVVRKKQGNHVSREGNNPKAGGGDDPMRSFTRGLFDRAQAE